MNRLRESLVTVVCCLLRFLFRSRSLRLAPRSLLILKPCCLGDVLMSTPTIVALRRAFPQARIDFAVGGWSRPVVEHNPRLDGLVDCGPVGSGPYSWADYRALVRRLRAGGYDACFVLDRSPLMALLPWLAGIPHRIGLDSGGRGFAHTVRVPVEGVKHEAELYLDTVRAAGIEVVAPRLEFFPTETDRVEMERILSAALSSFPSPPSPLALIHPGGGANPGMTLSAKRWPPPRFAALADRLMAEAGATVLLVGGPGDEPLAEAVKGAMQHQPVDLTGRLSLGQLGALCQRSRLFVGNDTGAMHLAVAVGTPTVALFGPSDPRMYGPFGAGHVALWHDMGCNPCFVAGRFRADCARFRCIEAVTVDEVWAAACGLLGEVENLRKMR